MTMNSVTDYIDTIAFSLLACIIVLFVCFNSCHSCHSMCVM